MSNYLFLAGKSQNTNYLAVSTGVSSGNCQKGDKSNDRLHAEPVILLRQIQGHRAEYLLYGRAQTYLGVKLCTKSK